MTKRQAIAAHALQGLLYHNQRYPMASLATAATEFADKLLTVTDSGESPISAREEIASLALSALICNDPYQEGSQRTNIAREAVALADAVLAAAS